MPELPEVEVTRRRLEPAITGKRIEHVVVRTVKLRLPVPDELPLLLAGCLIRSIKRRGKYLLFDCEKGWLLIHLGMTGFLQHLSAATPAGKHDHVDIILSDSSLLRYHDPRKFGIVSWFTGDPAHHSLLENIGPEPLTDDFSGEYLFAISRNRSVALKQLIMNSKVVAGVGNIYANEALFRAAIRPDRSSGTVSFSECERLVGAIRTVLEESIGSGSTFRVAEETVAYYPQTFKVYGRGGKACLICGNVLDEIRLGNRSTVYCRTCQR